MKTHYEGTNGRKFCGHKINGAAIITLDELKVTCEMCIGRLLEDHRFCRELFSIAVKAKEKESK